MEFKGKNSVSITNFYNKENNKNGATREKIKQYTWIWLIFQWGNIYHGDDDVKISSIIIIVEMGPRQCHKYYHEIGKQMKLQMKVQMKTFQQTFVL